MRGLGSSVAALGALLALTTTLASPGRAESNATKSAPHPNVLVVAVDTVRHDHLGFMGYMGYTRATSPHIDAFAARSWIFTQHRSHSSRTGPSVASVFTGRLPGAVGVFEPLGRNDRKGVLGAQHTTLAEHFRAAGYATHAAVANTNLSARLGFRQGFDQYQQLPPGDHGVALNEAARKVFAQRSSDARPFFLYLHYMGAHGPYAAEPAFATTFLDPGYSTAQLSDQRGAFATLDISSLSLQHPYVEYLRGLYDQSILTFDRRFGELLSDLEQSGIARDTLVVLLSDHGEEFFDHGSFRHGFTLFEEQLRVPLVIHDPRRAGEARRIDVPSQHIDVLPSLLDLAGLPAGEAQPGRSLVPGQGADVGPTDQVRPIYAQVQLTSNKTYQLRSVQSGHWKLIEQSLPAPRLQLFDLRTDPLEATDVSAQHPAQLKKLKAMLDDVAATEASEPSETVELSEDEMEQLRALGYLDDRIE